MKLNAYRCDRCRRTWTDDEARPVDSPESFNMKLTDRTMGNTQEVEHHWSDLCRTCVSELYKRTVTLNRVGDES